MPYEYLGEHQKRALSAALLLENRTAILYRCESVLSADPHVNRAISSQILVVFIIFYVAQHRPNSKHRSNPGQLRNICTTESSARCSSRENVISIASQCGASKSAMEIAVLQCIQHIKRVLAVKSVPA